MTPRRRLAAAVAVAAAAVAGAQLLPAAVARETAVPASPTYYRDVKPIVDGRCISCHTLGGIAPFSLTTYESARRRRSEIARAVANRHMPPWHAAPGHRRYRFDPSLTNEQNATLVRWAKRGAPKGSPATAQPSLPSVTPQLSRIDLRLPMPEPYTPRPRAGRDDYRCFVLPWLAAAPQFITGMNVTPGARGSVHHIIVYLAPPDYATTVERWDAGDRGPGYGCYGGPSANGAQALPIELLGGWVPGSAGSDFPAGTGLRVRPGSRVILQVHYNLDAAKPRPDRSVVELKIDPAVERRAVFLPIVDFRWLIARETFRIPAGRKRVVHSASGDPRLALRFLTPDLTLENGFAIHSALLHMHRLGRSGELVLEHAGGRRETLLAIRGWDFDWQREYRFAEDAVFAPGDRISVRCVHDNSRANQPVLRGKRAKPRTVTWGENSSDEMCLGFLYVSER